MSTNARSKFLSAGYFPHFKELSCDHGALMNMGFQGHIIPVPATLVLYLAKRNGFVVEKVATNKFKRNPKLKDRLLAFLIRRVSRRYYSDEDYRLLLSDDVLYGDVLVFALRKHL